MYRIIDGRGTGKTSRLMLLAKENNAVIVCKNPKSMLNKAHAYGIFGLEFLSYYEFLSMRGARLGKYYIDEIEDFIKTVQTVAKVDGTFDGYSLSEDD